MHKLHCTQYTHYSLIFSEGAPTGASSLQSSIFSSSHAWSCEDVQACKSLTITHILMYSFNDHLKSASVNARHPGIGILPMLSLVCSKWLELVQMVWTAETITVLKIVQIFINQIYMYIIILQQRKDILPIPWRSISLETLSWLPIIRPPNRRVEHNTDLCVRIMICMFVVIRKRIGRRLTSRGLQRCQRSGCQGQSMDGLCHLWMKTINQECFSDGLLGGLRRKSFFYQWTENLWNPTIEEDPPLSNW